MNKRKTLFGRAIALVLAFVMVCSSLGTSTITAYAAGSAGDMVTVADDTTEPGVIVEDVSGNEAAAPEIAPEESSQEELADEGVVEETTATENIEEISVESLVNTEVISLYNTEGEAEELGYIGTVEEDYWGQKLVINAGDMEAAGMSVSANNIVAIIEADRDETFSVVELNMNSITGTIATQVWNAVANAVVPSENEGHTELRYNQSGGNAADENWCFANPAVTEELINFDITYSGTENGISFTVDSLSVPSDDFFVNLYTDEKKEDYESLAMAWGISTVGGIYHTDGSVVMNIGVGFERGGYEDAEGKYTAGINISLDNLKNLNIGEEYFVKSDTYRGKIEEDWCGDRLTIEQWAMEELGIAVTDQALIDIINTHEQKFGIVEFNVNAGKDEISVDLWNAAVGALQPGVDGHFEIRFNQGGGEYADENWNFSRPYAIETPASAINLDVQRFVGAECEGITLSFVNNEFPAQEVGFNLYTDQNKADYDGIVAAIGSHNNMYLYCDGNETEEIGAGIDRGSFIDEENGNEIATLNISFGDMKNVSVNTEYVAMTSAYMGHVDEEWLGKVFILDLGRMQEDGLSVSANTIAGILEGQEAEYGAVQINYMALVDFVPANVWNAAASLLNPEANEEGFVELRFNFCGGEEYADENWNILRPEMVDGDVDLAIDWNAVGAAGEGISISFVNTQLPAEGAQISICTDENRADYTAFSQAIGFKPQSVMLDGEGNPMPADVGYDAGTDDNGVNYYNVWAGNIRDFESGVPYTIKTVDYTGRLENWDGWECLWIAYYEAGKEEAFTTDELKDILAANAGVLVNEVYIEQPYGSGTISGNNLNVIDSSVVNAALPLLKEDNETVLSFAFSDEVSKRSFRITNPSGEAIETAILVDAGIHLRDDQTSVDAFVYKNGSVACDGLFSEVEDLEIVVTRESLIGNGLLDMFGDAPCCLSLEGTDIIADYSVNDNEVVIYIRNCQGMDASQSYKLVPAEYTGVVEDNVLFIYPWHAEPYGLEYTEELVVDILESYAEAGTKFARVEIGFIDEESDPYVSDISAKIYNAAAKILDPEMKYPDDDLGRGLKYILYKADGAVVWNYLNPTELDNDIQMKHWIGFDEKTGNVIMTTNIPDLSGTRVNFEFVPNDFEERDFTDDLKDRLGDGTEGIGYYLSPMPQREVIYFNYNAYAENDSRVQILINGIDALKNDTVYEVVRTDFGNAWTDIWDDGTEYHNLYISSRDAGKETFDKGDIEKYLSFRKLMGETFDCIYIEQGNSYDENYDLNNSIKKEDYNYIRTNFLNTEHAAASIVYVFDNSFEDENGIYIQDQIRYEFMNPAAMTKDMDASINFALVENYESNDKIIRGGLDVYMPKTTAPASGVNVQIHADYDSVTGEYLRNAFGDNPEEGIACKIITDKETLSTMNNDVWLSCYTSPVDYKENEPDRRICMFHITDAQKMPQSKYSRIYPLHYRGEDVLYVSRREILEAPVKGKDLLWKSFYPEAAVIGKDATGNYYIDPIKEGAYAVYGYYCVANDGTPVVELYFGDIQKKVVSMKFANASETNPMVVELPPSGGDWINGDYLDLRFFPTGIGLDNSELEWFVGTVEDPTVSANCIEFLKDPETGYEWGEFVALEAGEVIVTVTAKDDPTLKATAKVIVKPAVVDEIDWDSIQIMAFDGYDKTLADLNDLLPEGFAWVDGNTSISGYKDFFHYEFPAIYTSPEDGRIAQVNVPIMILSVESALEVTVNDEFYLENGAVLEDGRTADLEIFSFVVNSMNPDMARSVDDMNAMLSNFGRDDIRFTVSASSNPKNILVQDEENDNLYHFTANSAQKGKKTFTLSLNIVDVETKKAVTFKKLSHNITVVAKPLFDWQSYLSIDEDAGYNGNFHKIPDGSEYPVVHDAMSIVGEKGVYVLTQPADNYFKLTVKSLDTTVCKIGKIKVTDSGDKSEKITTIPYEIKNGGVAFIEITAADEIKSKERIVFEVFDMMPKASAAACTIDSAYNDMSASVSWQLKEETDLLENEITWTGKESDKFHVSISEMDSDESGFNDLAVVTVELLDRALKAGKYKFDITVPVTLDDRTEEFTTTVTVTVKTSKVNVSAKQSDKVKLFYDRDSEASFGALDLSCAEAIYAVELVDQSQSKTCDYELVPITEDYYNYYFLRLKEGGNPKNVYGKLVVNAGELYNPIETKITIKTETKKPSYALVTSSSTVYPNFAGVEFAVSLKDKKNSNLICTDVLQIKNAAGEWVDFSEGVTEELVLKNNTYEISNYGGTLYGVLNTAKKATDKLSIRVRNDNWADEDAYLTYTYSVKVNTSVPTVALTSKTLTLNKNDEFYSSQRASTEITVKGMNNAFADTMQYSYNVEGADAKSIAALNSNLNVYFEYVWDDYGVCHLNLVTDFNGNDSIDAGNYKFKVSLYREGYKEISTTVTVKVVDIAAAKCLSVSAKGSIDVLDRWTTSVKYTPKLKNLIGTLTEEYSYLTGPDAGKFEAVTEGNALYVYARDGEIFSTKQTYYVTPVFVYESEDGRIFEIEGKQQKIKVKQGKPKVSAKGMDGNILYRDRNNAVEIDITALLKKQDVAIDRVELANYTGDLYCDYDAIRGTVILGQYDINQIVASGKTWKLKFNVYYKDRAVNEKPAQVTYSMVVK